MRNSIVLILGILMLVVGCTTVSQTSNKEESIQNSENAIVSKSTGTTQMDDVLIEITPISLIDEKFEFYIAANTHSVDLSQFNLMEIVTLNIDGKSLKPISAPQLTGHHAFGTIIFEVESNPNSYSIIIEGIPDIQTRDFTWNEAEI